ncbi:ATPase, T2SS/T4P/T4SS family [Candidatus Omnitrophota bacterium]
MPKKTDAILYDGLIEKGMIKKDALDALFKEAQLSGESLGKMIVMRGILPEKDLLGLLSEKLGITYVDLKAKKIDKAVLEKVPVKIATYYRFIPVDMQNGVLTIAVSAPLGIKTQDEIRIQLGCSIDMVLSTSEDISENLKKYYGLAADTLDRISTQGLEDLDSFPSNVIQDKVEDIEKLAEDASVIRLVNQIILEAYKKRATDIHLEPYRQGMALRYRIDGILYESSVPPEIKNFLSAIISRIKIMSNLNIVERRLPQDGRAVVKVADHVLDLRISVMPTPHGESVVIRILPTQMLYSIEKLGLPKRDFEIFENILKKPHGIVFVTGPTGSGKTTTLYACLSRLNSKDRKIITIEDPIEYEMSGITQIQVMPEIGLDFARGLRSMLRHDPDVMMVGEVRDLETAEIAIRVALTGHLVFSTLHTNDAASGIARLLDIGLEPFLVSSSIEALIAQRLIRVICPNCKQEDETVPSELKEQIAKDIGLKSVKEIKIFKGRGCDKCNLTGFFGRTAIYEILFIDDMIKDLIAKRVPSSDIKRVAIKKGMRTLRQGGWEKVLEGVTVPEEVMRVTQSEEDREGDDDAEDFIKQTSRPKDSQMTAIENNSDINGPDSDYAPSEAADESEYANKRIYPRLRSTINIRYKIFGSEKELLQGKGGKECFSVTKNISAGGLLFESNDQLQIGSVLELKIELADTKDPIECLARITRVAERVLDKVYEIGVCFLDVAGADRSRIVKYVNANMSTGKE